MDRKTEKDIRAFLKRDKRKKAWRRVVGVMMSIVVFATTYALILPAITMETDTFCGKEAHTHDDRCYREETICNIHVHTETCYEQHSELICTEPAESGHLHTEECAPVIEAELACTLEETEGHIHSEACSITEQTLTCALEESEEHTHTEDCYTSVTTNVCGLEEIPAHTHGKDCFNLVTVYGCGSEEILTHVHTDACYETSLTLICTEEADPEHQHVESCSGSVLICEKEEHEHELICYSDPNADLESAEYWETTIPGSLSGNYAEDVLAVAASQLGYAESSKNYAVDGGEMKGYTRYGAWYGIPHGDWCAMFASFCLNYAGVDHPAYASCIAWADALRAQNLYQIPSEYIPKAGDLIFFDWEQDGIIDHVGFVEKLDGTNVITIEGNSANRVARNTYELFDQRIAGYGLLAPAQPEQEEIPAEDSYLDQGSTNAWVELVGEPTVAAAPQEEIGTPKMRSFAQGATTFGLARTTMTSARAIGTPLDLTPYINNVAMYDSDGNPIENGSTVTEGDLIEFKIEYTVTGQQLGVLNGETVTPISDTLIYDLPDLFQIIQSDSGDIRNSAGQKVGTYLIDNTTGQITMSFTEDYLEQNAKGIQIHGYISFFSTVTKITNEDDEHQNFEFTDKITLGIVIEEKTEIVGDLSIEKEKAIIDGEDIVYEITVTSAEGTNGSITITDEMSAGLTFKEGISVMKGNSRVNNAQFNVAADKSSFTMTLPEMKAGESYTIRYRCTTDIDLLDADMTVENTASVTGKDSTGKDLEDDVTVDHTFDVLRKTGQLNDDGSISWTITINWAKLDISGWTLEDIMTTGNTANSYTGPVTIKDSSGNTIAANATLPYTFPRNSTDTYTVTYTTTHNFGDGHTIYNTAILKDDNTEVTVLTGVDIGSPFEKTGEAGEIIQDENGTYLLPITWTVTIDTTDAPISGGVYFNDRLDGYPSDDMYMTYEQLMGALNSIEAELLRVANQEVEWFSAWEYKPGTDSSGEAYSIIDLWNNKDNCQSMVFDRFAIGLADKGIPQGHVLTFSYEAYGVFPNNIVSTTTFKNRFSLMDQYVVEGRVDHVAGTVKATKYAISYYDPETQEDQGWFWGTIDWNGVEGTSRYDFEDLNDSYLAWTIEVSIPPNYTGKDDIIIFEDLPEGVTVTDLSWVFQDNMPTSHLQLKDIVPGETYTWDFLLYTAQQYHQNWGYRDGQPVSITVNVTEAGDVEIIVPGVIFETMGQFAALRGVEEAYGYLNIFTQIDDDFDWTPTEGESYVYVNRFENRFTITNEKDVVLDIGSQTQVITKDEREGMIRKEATTDANNIITYSVLLNAYGRDLIENAGSLAIHDELTYESTEAEPLRLRLVPGSVTLYEVDVKSDGSYTKLGEVTANYSYGESSSERNGITTWTHTIDLNIPDGKALLLEYSYKATGTKDAEHDVFNVCTITGVGEGSLEGDTKVEIELKDATAQADTSGVMIYKVDANSDGLFLENARFNIYIWNKEQGKYIIVHHPNNGGTDFTTDANGMIVLDGSTMDEDQFAYNTAYYIVEVESPNGYYLSPEPYYFYIKHDNTEKYPSCIPANFTGHALTSGDIIYRQNVSEFTEITVEKYWLDFDGAPVTVTGEEVSSVTLELWQMLQGDPDSAKLFGTYTITPDEDGNWSLTITDLPKATKNADGTRGTNYLYYIKEVRVGGYTLESTQNNAGINSGTIKLVNRKTDTYLLPKTGGAGTQPYTAAGLLLMLTSAAYLVYISRKRRREAT